MKKSHFSKVLCSSLIFAISCEIGQPDSVSTLWGASEYPKVFFSYPGRFVPEGKKRNVRDEIIQIIRETKHDIYMHIYSFQDPEIESELLAASKRGVRLEFLGEWGKIYPESLLPYLKYWKGTGLQHTKVLVSDQRIVFLGTGNFTFYGLERDLNGYIEFRLQENEIDSFRAFLEEEYSLPNLRIGNLEFRNSPLEGKYIQTRFLNSVGYATDQIDYLIFDHYDPVLSTELSRSKAGIIRGVYDRPVDPEGNILSSIEKFQIYEDGNEDRLDDSDPGKGGLLHHKSMMFDKRELLTGSFNFSASARDSNREISLRILDPQVVGEFANEFERIRVRANPIVRSTPPYSSEFVIDTGSGSLCRVGTEPEEILLETGKSWFHWRNFYKFRQNESCKSFTDYETISSRYFGGKSEFPSQGLAELGYRLTTRKGKTIETFPNGAQMGDFFSSLEKPVLFLGPEVFLWNDSAWTFPDVSFLQEFSSQTSTGNVWILSRGKLPRRSGFVKEGNVHYLSEDLDSKTGVIIMEYEKFNLYFCYKEVGSSLVWPNEVLFAVLENSELYTGIQNQKKMLSDFFGIRGLPNRRKENLCSVSF